MEAEKLTFEITSHKGGMNEIAVKARVKKCEEQMANCGNKISYMVDNLRHSQNGNWNMQGVKEKKKTKNKKLQIQV